MHTIASRLGITILAIAAFSIPLGMVAYAQAPSTVFQTLTPSGTSAFNAASTEGGGTPASADVPAFSPLTNVKGTPFEKLFGTGATLTGLFQGLFNLSITIGALLAVLMIAWSGYQYLFSDVVKMKTDAKARIQNALLGLLMLLATVLILRQINPDIVSLRVIQNQPGTSSSQSASSNQSADTGFTTTTPYGNFCSTVGSGQYYCYHTAQACENTFGANGCTAWNGSSAETGINIPIEASNYAIQWNGTVADTQNSCGETYGVGWQNLPSSYCGSSNTALGACCGLPKAQSISNVSGALNHFCFTSSPNSITSYYCFADANTCATYQNQYATTNNTVVNTCALYNQSALGVLHQTTLPANAKDYSQFQWVSNAGKDAQGNLLSCSSTVASGWIEVASNLCSGAISMPTSECCALPKTSTTGTAGQTTTVTAPTNETQYSTSNLTLIPNNRYCYRNSTTAFCTTTEGQCTANQSLYTTNNPGVTVQKCALFTTN